MAATSPDGRFAAENSRIPAMYDMEDQADRQGAQIKLIVGPGRTTFDISEDRICRKCPFFYNALSGTFLEAQSKTITFPEDTAEDFALLTAWILEQDVPNINFTWLDLVKLWFFAEKYHVDDLQNAVINTLYAKYASRHEGINIATETLDYVAEHSYPSSPLRRLFADMLANGISLQQLPDRLESIPHELLGDVCLMLKTNLARNGPSNISLISNPIKTYYSSSAACKATAVPPPIKTAAEGGGIYCEGVKCTSRAGERVPINGTLHICTNHNVTLCHDCRHSHHGHRKKMMSLISPAYNDAVLGNMTVIDAQNNDSGFYCDGTKCDTRLKKLSLPDWALMSGDRYHCLVCHNVDFCSICVRGELPCKEAGHLMLRIRPSFARKTFLTEAIPIPERQKRLDAGLCMRCSSSEHQAGQCEAKEAVFEKDVLVEE